MALHSINYQLARSSITIDLRSKLGINSSSNQCANARASILQDVAFQPLQSPESGKGSRSHRSWTSRSYAPADATKTCGTPQISPQAKPIATRTAICEVPVKSYVPSDVYEASAIGQ